MIRAAVYSALLCAGIAGCAALRPEQRPGPEDQLERGLAALEAEDYLSARRLLEPVYLEHWQKPVGQHALLALAAADLDGRNPNRRLAQSADFAGRYLGIDGARAWTVPVAEALYLAALELGAQEDTTRLQGRPVAADSLATGQPAATGRGLPTSPRPSVLTRIRRVQVERDSLLRRLESAEQRLAAREKELREAQQELERIRKTIKR